MVEEGVTSGVVIERERIEKLEVDEVVAWI